MELKQLPKVALGAWAWGNDGTFGGNLIAADLRPVFDAAMKAGLMGYRLCVWHGYFGKGTGGVFAHGAP